MQAVAAPRKLKFKLESVEGGCTRAAFTMQAVAAPTKLKTTWKSSRRRSHRRRNDNASGRGNKVETQTRINPKTVAHAPHSQCKRQALTKLKPKRESARRRSHTQRIHNGRGLPCCLRASRLTSIPLRAPHGFIPCVSFCRNLHILHFILFYSVMFLK